MSIALVRNSPIGWRDLAEDTWTQCENTYSQAWINGETLRFQVKVLKIGQNILINETAGTTILEPYKSGTSTSDGSSTLIDNTTTFNSPPTLADHLVFNASEVTQTTVFTAPTGTDTLALNADIFGAATLGDSYELIRLTGLIGNIAYNGNNNSVAFAPTAFEPFFVVQDAFPDITNRYIVEVDIEDYAGGLLRVQSGTLGGGYNTLGESPDAEQNGTISFYGIPVGLDMKISGNVDSAFTVTGIRIYESSQVKWYLTNSEFTTEYDNGTPLAAQYIHDRCIVEITPSVADGEYAIQIEDRALSINGGYIRNYDFASNSDYGWTIVNATSNGWTITSNELQHASGGGTGTNTAEVELRQTTETDCNYRISGTLTGDGALVEGLQVDGTYVSLGTLTTTLNFTGYALTHLRFSMTEVDTGTIDDIVLQPVLTCPSLESYPICIAATLDSLFLEMVGTIGNTGGAVLKKDRRLIALADYVEKMYIGANIRFARYDDPDGEAYRDSTGRSSVVFSDRIKIQECQLAPVPVWVHDWLTWALRTIYTVDGVELYPYELGSYSPSWDKRTASAPVVFDLAEQDQDIKSTSCD